MTKLLYEDEDWIIEQLNDDEETPKLRITSFKDNHYVDEIEISREMFTDLE